MTPQSPGEEAVVCLKGVGGAVCIAVGAAEGKFNKVEMTPGVFHGSGHCTHRFTRETGGHIRVKSKHLPTWQT